MLITIHGDDIGCHTEIPRPRGLGDTVGERTERPTVVIRTPQRCHQRVWHSRWNIKSGVVCFVQNLLGMNIYTP